MKTLLAGVLVLASLTASANVCQLDVVLSAEADKVMLYMEDKDIPNPDGDVTVQWTGGNPNKLDCESLVKEIIKSGRKTVEIDGEVIPLQLKVVRTINL